MDSHNTTVPIQSAIPAIPEGQARQMGLLPPPTVAAPPNPDNGSMTLRDFAMFMSGNARMNRNNALQDNIDDDEDMNVITRANSPTSFNNVIDNSNALNEEQKNIIKQEYNNRVIGQVRRVGTLDGQNNRPPKAKYVNNPDFAEFYMNAYNAARVARTQMQEAGAPEPRTRAQRAALTEEEEAGVDPERAPASAKKDKHLLSPKKPLPPPPPPPSEGAARGPPPPPPKQPPPPTNQGRPQTGVSYDDVLKELTEKIQKKKKKI